MNLYLIENGRKVEVGEYVQVGHRLVHRDEIVSSGTFNPVIHVRERVEYGAPDKPGNRFKLSSRIMPGHFLRINVEGEFDYANGAEIIDEIMKLCRSAGGSGLLVDFHATRMQTNTVEQFYLVHDLVSSGYQGIGKMAVVTNAPKTGFFEKAARNRMIDMRFFIDSDDAQTWLAA